ncbi:FliM/FliN family flagellar motor switch protein [Chitinimonas sp.]|uniref:FliM/FliN family flagellar motor switch protein n=1 Tax=Chitinimonas sp. TaxID=1934313 RepID=UPI0035AEB70C
MSSSEHAADAIPQPIALDELPGSAAHAPSLLSGHLALIKNVKVQLSVKVGEAQVSVGELLQMREDHLLTLDRPLDAPVDILLDGQVVARGQLVAVDDQFGVRITELPRLDAGAAAT